MSEFSTSSESNPDVLLPTRRKPDQFLPPDSVLEQTLAQRDTAKDKRQRWNFHFNASVGHELITDVSCSAVTRC